MGDERADNVGAWALDQLEQRARSMGKAGRYGREAEEVNSRILAEEPANVRALVRRGRCRFERDELAGAREDFRRASGLDPKNTVAPLYLERINRGWDQWLGRERTKERRREKAREARRLRNADFRKVRAIETFPDARKFGDGVRKAADHELAAAAYWRAFRLDPRRLQVDEGAAQTDAGVYLVPKKLAATYRSAGKLRAAHKIYVWVRERRDDRYAKVGHAAVYSDRGLFEEAKSLCDDALAEHPGDPYALNCKGRACYGLERREEAAEAFELAVKNSGSDRDVAEAARRGLEEMRRGYLRRGDEEGAGWVASKLTRTDGTG